MSLDSLVEWLKANPYSERERAADIAEIVCDYGRFSLETWEAHVAKHYGKVRSNDDLRPVVLDDARLLTACAHLCRAMAWDTDRFERFIARYILAAERIRKRRGE